MLYRAHLVAGVAAGGSAVAAATAAGIVQSLEQQAGVFGLWVAFSLLPDLDTASVTQRWFYRGLFLLLVALLVLGRTREAALLGTAGTLPLVHRHRGWMHRWWAALVVPAAALLLWEFCGRGSGPGNLLSRETLASFAGDVMARHWIYWASMAGGYGLHLVVDFRLPAVLRWGRLP